MQVAGAAGLLLVPDSLTVDVAEGEQIATAADLSAFGSGAVPASDLALQRALQVATDKLDGIKGRTRRINRAASATARYDDLDGAPLKTCWLRGCEQQRVSHLAATYLDVDGMTSHPDAVANSDLGSAVAKVDTFGNATVGGTLTLTWQVSADITDGLQQAVLLLADSLLRERDLSSMSPGLLSKVDALISDIRLDRWRW